MDPKPRIFERYEDGALHSAVDTVDLAEVLRRVHVTLHQDAGPCPGNFFLKAKYQRQDHTGQVNVTVTPNLPSTLTIDRKDTEIIVHPGGDVTRFISYKNTGYDITIHLKPEEQAEE